MYELESMALTDSPISNHTSGISLIVKRTFFRCLWFASFAHHSLADLVVLLILAAGILASRISVGRVLHSGIQ